MTVYPLLGLCDLPDGIVLSVPVTLTDGKWSPLLDVTVGDELKERLGLCANELQQVCHNAKPDVVKPIFLDKTHLISHKT